MSSVGSETVFLFCYFYFFPFCGQCKLKCFFFCRKMLWQIMPAHCHSLHLPHINEPSLHVHYILLLRQRCQKSQLCEGIDKVLLNGPKFKVQFWKTKKGSLARDVQCLIFFMIFHARNWKTKIYSIFISIKYMTPKINYVAILFQFCLSHAQRPLDFSSADVFLTWLSSVRQQIRCVLHSKHSFL